MSKLIDRLEKVGTVAPAPMGFAAARAAERAPALLMLALSGAKDVAATGLQTDGFIVSTAKTTKTQLKAVKQAMGDGLWGLWPGNANGVSLDQIREHGGDFVVFSSSDTPAELLADEEIGRLIVIPIEFPEDLGHSLEDFPVDAVVVGGLEDASPLSVKALMQVRAVRDLVAKPLLLLRAKPLSRGELVVLQDVGMQGSGRGLLEGGAGRHLTHGRRTSRAFPRAGRSATSPAHCCRASPPAHPPPISTKRTTRRKTSTDPASAGP